MEKSLPVICTGQSVWPCASPRIRGHRFAPRAVPLRVSDGGVHGHGGPITGGFDGRRAATAGGPPSGGIRSTLIHDLELEDVGELANVGIGSGHLGGLLTGYTGV